MTTSRSKKAKPTSLTAGASRHAKRHLVSVARAAEVADAHGNKLAQLLDIQVNGSSSGGRCSWTLATLDDTDREKRAAVAWVIANSIIRARCGRAKGGAVKERVTRGEVVRVGSVRRGRTRAPRRRLAQVAVDGGAGDWQVTPNSAAIWATVCLRLPSASHSSHICCASLA